MRRSSPNEPGESMKDRVQKVIDVLRPVLQADGGDVELVEVVDNVVKVRLPRGLEGKKL
jgi:Fe-S cluster biogenesis protein NfuA